MIDQTKLYRCAASGNLYGVERVGETTATLFMVEPSEQTMITHWKFLEDNKHAFQANSELRGQLFQHPRHTKIEVDHRWFERSDVKVETCDHSRNLDVARLCPRCVAGVCSEHQPVDASDDRARNDADERGGR